MSSSNLEIPRRNSGRNVHTQYNGRRDRNRSGRDSTNNRRHQWNNVHQHDDDSGQQYRTRAHIDSVPSPQIKQESGDETTTPRAGQRRKRRDSNGPEFPAKRQERGYGLADPIRDAACTPSSGVSRSRRDISVDPQQVHLGLPVDYVPPTAPVYMSWRGRKQPYRFNEAVHYYGKPLKSGKRNEGALHVGRCNLQPDENLRLCLYNYCDPARYCRYLAPVSIDGVERTVQCANNHGLTQEELNEMFYSRRITRTEARDMVACNSIQPRPLPDCYVPLHVPVAPPSYNEATWVIKLLPDEFKQRLKEENKGNAGYDFTPLDLRYAEKPVDPYAVDPLVARMMMAPTRGGLSSSRSQADTEVRPRRHSHDTKTSYGIKVEESEDELDRPLRRRSPHGTQVNTSPQIKVEKFEDERSNSDRYPSLFDFY